MLDLKTLLFSFPFTFPSGKYNYLLDALPLKTKFLEKMIFGSQGEQGSRILSHEMNMARFTHAVTSLAQVQRCNHSQRWSHFREFEKKSRQKFNHEGNHRLWNRGDSSCLVLLNHSIVGLIFIHQGMVKMSALNNASSASDVPRAPPESSWILVSVRKYSC